MVDGGLWDGGWRMVYCSHVLWCTFVGKDLLAKGCREQGGSELPKEAVVPHWDFSCSLLAGGAGGGALLPATGPAHPVAQVEHSAGSVGGVRSQLLPPLLLGNPHVVAPPAPRDHRAQPPEPATL